MLGWRVTGSIVAASLVVVAACSTGRSGGEPASSVTTGAGGTATSTASGGNAVGGAPVGSECCEPEQAELLPGNGVEVGQDLCSPEQVDGFSAACLEDFGGTETLCTDWLADEANQPCEECILGTNTAGPMPALLVSGNSNTIWVPVFACEAMISDRPECAMPLQALVFCVWTACRSCPSGSAVEEACWWYAVDEVCTHPAASAPPECMDLIEQQTPPCVGADFNEFYTNVTNYICGPPI